LCLQLSGIYFESGLAKLAVTDWVNGSALFYITRDPMFGSVGIVGDFLHWFTCAPAGTALLTWGTIIAEVAFGVLFLAPAPIKKYGLVGAVVLHLGIGLVMGLWSFALAMIGTAVVAAYTLRESSHPTPTERVATNAVAAPEEAVAS
jgi:antimicrobial peptide system SdpB family protein